MEQNRAAFLVVAQIAQHGQQMVHVMAVDRADIVEAQLLEQRAAGEDAAGIFLGPLGRPLDRAREALRHLGGEIAQIEKGARGDQP